MALFDNTAGTQDIQKAIDALNAIGVPNAAQLTLPELQKYVVAGVLTPQQLQSIQANPQVYQQTIQATQDNSGKNAQSAALQQLGNVVQAGGSTAINKANLLNNVNQTNQAMQAARGGIQQQAQQQGVSGGGQEFLNQMMNEQQNSQNANTGAVNAAANNAQLALSAMTQQGQLGGTMQGQANQMSQAQADAAQQIAEYNNQLQNQAAQYNTQNANQAQQMNLANAQQISGQNVGNANQRTMYNAAVPQTVYQDQMQKATGLANAYTNLGQQAAQQQGQQNAMYGQLIGTGATVLGGMYGGPAGAAAGKAAADNMTGKPASADTTSQDYNRNMQQMTPYSQGGEVKGMNQGGMCYAQGGEVHDHEICMQIGGTVPGDDNAPPMDDSQANDTVDAKLSPHEIVLPKSVAQAPNAPDAAAQFVGNIKGSQTAQGPAPQAPGMLAGSSRMGLAGPTVNSFAEVLAKLEENGLELRLAPSGASNGI